MSSAPKPTQRISVVAPMFNEAANVAAFLDRVVAVLGPAGVDFEIVCVDDGSVDGTVAALRAAAHADPRVRPFRLSRNFGKEVAITAGLDHAKGDAVVVIDSDLQHDPALMLAMLAKWREGFDVVYAQRRARADQAPIRRALSSAFYRMFNHIVDVRIPPGAGDYRLLDRKVVDALCQMRERNRFMKGLFAYVGYRSAAVEYDVQDRAAGVSSWGLWRLWNFALDGITSFSTVPLRIWVYVGMLVAGCSFVAALYLVISTILYGRDVPGYASIVVLVLFLGGIQLLTLGVLGEYIGRIFLEVKARPLYLLDTLDERSDRLAQRTVDPVDDVRR